MKEIKLSKGHITLVDDEDFENLNRFKWSFLKHGDSGYAVRSVLIGHRDSSLPKGDSKNQIMKMIYMHRFILGILDNTKIDHKDGNKLNNQKYNLRKATKSQNGMNSKKRIDNLSGYRGVDWVKRNKKWRARVKVNGKEVYSGYFDNIHDAAKAYNEAAKKYHGEFARLNEIAF